MRALYPLVDDNIEAYCAGQLFHIPYSNDQPVTEKEVVGSIKATITILIELTAMMTRAKSRTKDILNNIEIKLAYTDSTYSD